MAVIEPEITIKKLITQKNFLAISWEYVSLLLRLDYACSAGLADGVAGVATDNR